MLWEPVDYKGRAFGDFHVRQSSSDGPGWFIFGRNDQYGGQLVKLVGRPDVPLRKHRSYNVKTRAGWRTKRDAEAALAEHLGGSVQQNPALATFIAGNPPSAIASDVLLIVYRHAKDGKYYAHQFGGGDVRFRKIHGRQVIAIDDLPPRSQVRMFGDGQTVVLAHAEGKPLSKDFR